MKLNLNDPKDLSLERVREFIASSDDTEHRQIRVTKGGVAFISDAVGADNTEGLAFRLGTFSAGTNRLGQEASEDAGWVKRIQSALSENWPTPTGEYVDDF